MHKTIPFDPEWQRLGHAALSDKQLGRFLHWLYSNRYAVPSADKAKYQQLLNRLQAEMRRRRERKAPPAAA